MKLLFEYSYFNLVATKSKWLLKHLDFDATIHYIGGEPA
jgi:hypothetical protein